MKSILIYVLSLCFVHAGILNLATQGAGYLKNNVFSSSNFSPGLKVAAAGPDGTKPDVPLDEPSQADEVMSISGSQLLDNAEKLETRKNDLIAAAHYETGLLKKLAKYGKEQQTDENMFIEKTNIELDPDKIRKIEAKLEIASLLKNLQHEALSNSKKVLVIGSSSYTPSELALLGLMTSCRTD